MHRKGHTIGPMEATHVPRTSASTPGTRRPRLLPVAPRILLAAAFALSTTTPTRAHLVVDLAASEATLHTRFAEVRAPDPDGFRVLRFGPAHDPDPSVEIVLSDRAAVDPAAWRSARTLKMHIQNTMPWPVTLGLMLMDAQGAALRASVALPPGPPATLTLPLSATSPLRWGMRAPPAQPFMREGEPLLVAPWVDGTLDRSRVRALRLSVPAHDAAAVLRIGKVFLERTRDDERALYAGIIDCLGQSTRADWPGKRRCDGGRPMPGANDAPATAVATEPAPTDVGADRLRADSGYAATGFFRVARAGGDRATDGRHVLVTPDGRPFFSLGVNAIQLRNATTFVEGREFMFQWLPDPADRSDPLAAFFGRRDSRDTLGNAAGAQRGRGFGAGATFDFYRANVFRLDGDDGGEAWRARTRARLASWGFNTAGAWSEDDFTIAAGLAYTPIVHVEGDFARLSDGHDWWNGIPDPFDPAFASALERQFLREVAPRRNERNLLGWFVDNELGWGNGAATDPGARHALALGALRADASTPRAYAKRAFVAALRERHRTPQAFASAWGLPIDSWEELNAPMLGALAPDANRAAVAADLQALQALHADAYFRQVHDALARHAPNHLYLGARFASRTPEAVAACVRWCDVVSFNLYLPDLRNGFEASAFALHDKPALLTEFHFGSSDRGPFWAGVMPVAREEDRAPAYARMLESVLADPRFVGAHWFQYLDQPASGRWLDGENGHLGLVDITDTPWPQFVGAVAATNGKIERSFMQTVRASRVAR